MKRNIYFFLIFLLSIPVLYYSAPVDIETAKQVALNLYSERSNFSEFSIVEKFVETDESKNIFYIFNFDPTGFVFISADDIVVPILGYSFDQNYGLENHPPQFDAMLSNFKEQIVYAIENGLSTTMEIRDEWSRLNVASENFEKIRYTKDVFPLLSTKWDQGQYYNEMCPYDTRAYPYTGNNYVLAGCVATAMAQVMKYWSYPTTGTGSHGYYDEINYQNDPPEPIPNSNYGWQYADFGATTYNWTNMPDSVTSLNTDVQTLLYHCGVSVEMNYGPYGSGAYTSDVVPASTTYFNYDTSAQFLWKLSYTDPVWAGMLRDELDNGRPLIYRGYDPPPPPQGGHAFVIDGYQGTNCFHVNWGSSGIYNDYYYLTNLNPGSYNFTADQGGIFTLMPSSYPPSIDVTAPNNVIADEWCVIQWTDGDPDDNAWIYLYYDNNDSGYDGTCINSGNPIFEDGSDVYVWNTNTIPEGTYWVYAIIDDGTSQDQDYSPGYVEIHHPAQADNFSYRDMEIDTEDGDPYIESGEEVDMEIKIRNDSYTTTFYYVDATLSTSNPYITITDNLAYYGNFNPRQSKMEGDFNWESTPSFTGDVDFELLLEYKDEDNIPYFEHIDIPTVHVYTPGSIGANFEVLNDQTLYFDNVEYANGDGILQSGELRVRYALKLKNIGNGEAIDILVEVLDTPPAGIDLGDRDVDYPDLDPDESSYQIQDDTLTIRVDKNFSGQVNLDLFIEYNDNNNMTIPFILDVEPAAWWFSLPEELINFGQKPPGFIDTTIVIQNLGTATLTINYVEYSDPDISILDSIPPFNIQSGQSADIDIRLDASSLYGFVSREIIFNSNDHLESQDTLKMIGTVYEGISDFDLVLVNQFDTGAGPYPGLYGEPKSIAAGDFDGDGMDEIAITTGAYYYGNDFMASALVIFDYQNDSWTRVYYDTSPGCIEDTKNLEVEDLDNDGKDEIVTCSRTGYDQHVPQSKVYIYDYDGSYYLANILRSNTYYKNGLTIGDVDNDGHKEIIFYEKESYGNPDTQSKIFVYEQTSGLNFSNIWTSPNLYEYEDPDDMVAHVAGINVADSDNDGINEILFMANYGQIFIYENFSLSFHLTTDDFNDWWDCDENCDMKVADTDTDGYPELLICSENEGIFYIVESIGNNSYNTSNPVIIENMDERNWIVIDDLNDNGLKEIYLLGDGRSNQSEIYVYENFADNSYTQIYSSPSGFIAEDILRGVIADVLPDKDNPVELTLAIWEDFIPIYGLVAPQPDLVIYDASIIFEGTLEENSEINIKYDITNIGNTDLTDILVRIYDNPPDSLYANLLEEKIISQILGGHTWSDSTLWIPTTVGNYIVHVLVDPDNTILEENEDNNTASKQVSIADDDIIPPLITDIIYSEESGDGDGLWEDNEEYRISWVLYDDSGISTTTCMVDTTSLIVQGSYPDYYCLSESLNIGNHIITIEAIDNDNSPLQSTYIDTVNIIQHAPNVIAFYPPDDSLNVPSNIIITATFDIDLIPESVNGNTFLLFKDGIQQNAQLITYNSDEKTAYFYPSSNLELGYQYIVTLKGGSDTLKNYVYITDINCNTLESDVSWNFWVGYHGIDEHNITIPTEFSLYQNYPNPIKGKSTFKFGLPRPSIVKLQIYNLKGQLLKTLIDEEKPAGYHTIECNTGNLKSGIYFYKLSTPDKTFIKKMILIK